jgi:hypothetical protein
MMSILMEFYRQRHEQERCIPVAGLALAYYPNDVGASQR